MSKDRFIEAFKNVTGIKPTINENVGVNSGFVTDKVKTTLYNIEKWEPFVELLSKHPDAVDYSLNTSTSKVNWNAELEKKQWGIHGIVIVANSIYCMSVIKLFDTNNDLIEEEHLPFNSADGEFLISTNLNELSIKDDIYPQQVDIDFAANQIRITF